MPKHLTIVLRGCP